MTEAQKYLINNNQHDLVINESKIAAGKDTNYRYLSDIMEEYANEKVKAEAKRIKLAVKYHLRNCRDYEF